MKFAMPTVEVPARLPLLALAALAAGSSSRRKEDR